LKSFLKFPVLTVETRQDLKKHYKHVLFVKINVNMIILVIQKKRKKDEEMFLFFIPTLKASFLWV